LPQAHDDAAPLALGRCPRLMTMPRVWRSAVAPVIMNAAPLALKTNKTDGIPLSLGEGSWLHKRQRRDLIKAWGIAPGTSIELVDER
jgi:hypothetical protein